MSSAASFVWRFEGLGQMLTLWGATLPIFTFDSHPNGDLLLKKKLQLLSFKSISNFGRALRPVKQKKDTETIFPSLK